MPGNGKRQLTSFKSKPQYLKEKLICFNGNREDVKNALQMSEYTMKLTKNN